MAEPVVGMLMAALAEQAATADPRSLPWLRRHGFSVWSEAERGIDTLPDAGMDEVIHVSTDGMEPLPLRLRVYAGRDGTTLLVLTDRAVPLDGEGEVPALLADSEDIGLCFFIAMAHIGNRWPVRFLMHKPGLLGELPPDMELARAGIENLSEVVFPGQVEGVINIAPHRDGDKIGFDVAIDVHPVSLLEFRALIGELPSRPFSL